MAAVNDTFDRVAVFINSLLRLRNGRRGLDRQTENYFSTVADTAQNTTSMVGCPAVNSGGVIVLTAQKFSRGKAIAEFNTFDRTQREHGVSKQGVQFIKNRFAPPRRNVGNAALDGSANTVTIHPGIVDRFRHRFGFIRVSSPDGIFFHKLPIKFISVNIANTAGATFDFHADLCQQQFGYRTGSNPGSSFAPGRTAAAAIIPDSVFSKITEIRVTGPENFRQIAVVAAALIGIADKHSKRGTGGNIFKDAGKDLHGVTFTALSGQYGLTGFAPVKLFLYIFCFYTQSGGNSVNDYAQSGPVRFAESGHSEK